MAGDIEWPPYQGSIFVELVVAAFLIVGVVVLWLPLLSELLCLARRSHETWQRGPTGMPRLLFLVPAHNEELLIGQCVRSLLAIDYAYRARRIVVIADNCSDSTAARVREAGGECLERNDPLQPGKPRALAWALTHFRLTDWDSCVIIDADSMADPGFAQAVAAYSPLRDIVVQGNFSVLNEGETWLTRLGGVLSRCRYQVTYPLKQAAGLNVPITGNGMCIGAGLLERDGWRAFSITEDSELYVQYTIAGVPILHARSATVYSQEAKSLRQGMTQRRRWFAGRLWAIRHYGGQILRSRHISWHQKLDTFVELGVASPVLHLILALFVALFAVLLLPRGVGLAIAVAAGLSLSGLLFTTLVVLWNHPAPIRAALSFLMLPIYAVWRIVVLIGTLLTLRDTRWKKTSRRATAEEPGTTSATRR